LVSFCEDDPDFGFIMQWQGTGSPATNPKITVELVSGAFYRVGSISDNVAHPNGPATAVVVGNTLEISLPDLVGSEVGEVAFELIFDCDIDFSNPVRLNIAVVSDEATFTDVTSPINNTYAAPQLVFNGGTNSTITGVMKLLIRRLIGQCFKETSGLSQKM